MVSVWKSYARCFSNYWDKEKPHYTWESYWRFYKMAPDKQTVIHEHTMQLLKGCPDRIINGTLTNANITLLKYELKLQKKNWNTSWERKGKWKRVRNGQLYVEGFQAFKSFSLVKQLSILILISLIIWKTAFKDHLSCLTSDIDLI